jgi:hypothetical protein
MLMTFLAFGRRARREYRVFRKLLGVVPRLEERLMGCTDDEAMGMADLVRVFDCNRMLLYFSSHLSQDPKGCFLCEVRRYQEYERRYPGLDNASRHSDGSTSCPEC